MTFEGAMENVELFSLINITYLIHWADLRVCEQGRWITEDMEFRANIPSRIFQNRWVDAKNEVWSFGLNLLINKLGENVIIK